MRAKKDLHRAENMRVSGTIVDTKENGCLDDEMCHGRESSKLGMLAENFGLSLRSESSIITLEIQAEMYEN